MARTAAVAKPRAALARAAILSAHQAGFHGDLTERDRLLAAGDVAHTALRQAYEDGDLARRSGRVCVCPRCRRAA